MAHQESEIIKREMVVLAQSLHENIIENINGSYDRYTRKMLSHRFTGHIVRVQADVRVSRYFKDTI